MAEVKLDWSDVDSSNVKSIAYDEDTETLCVRFVHGGLYSYTAVGQEVYVDMANAESVGKYLNDVVKGIYPYTRWFSEEELLADILSRRK